VGLLALYYTVISSVVVVVVVLRLTYSAHGLRRAPTLLIAKEERGTKGGREMEKIV
jgi:hypothetical protein